MASFKYINDIVSRGNLTQFLELVDLAAGAGRDVNKVFDLSDRLNGSRPRGVFSWYARPDLAAAVA
jgi:ubiquinone biosynthesis protein COQ4